MRSERSVNGNTRKQRIAFMALTLLSVILGASLLKVGVTNEALSSTNQKLPLTVKIEIQSDSPLLITVLRVDDSVPSQAVVSYVLQNVSNKAIRGFTVIEKEKTGETENITATTVDNPLRYLQPKEYNNDSFVERPYFGNIERLVLSIDYVEFEDGDSWGSDILKGSETLAGRSAGRIKAIDEINALLVQRSNVLTDLLKQELTEVVAPTPDLEKSSRWQNAFVTGYRSVVGQLQAVYQKQGIDGVSSKFREVEGRLKVERR